MAHGAILTGQLPKNAPFFRGSTDSPLVKEATHSNFKKILVVDDNSVLLRALSLALGARGYEVFTAMDASEAFGFARLEKLDLILLDIFFPPDVTQSGTDWDAFRIIEWMRRIGIATEVPIIVISGAEPEKFKDRCLAAGAVAFFHKPINIPELLGAIRGIFDPYVHVNEAELAAILEQQISFSTLPLPAQLSA